MLILHQVALEQKLLSSRNFYIDTIVVLLSTIIRKNYGDESLNYDSTLIDIIFTVLVVTGIIAVLPYGFWVALFSQPRD